MVSRSSEIRVIIDRIVAGYRPERIILFGSSARGSSDTDSDIDLLVIKQTCDDPWKRSQEVDDLIEHDAPVDILIYTPEEIEKRLSMNDFFLRDILNEGTTLYERKAP
jgi:predicted nucleotidyltransferase